MEFISKSSRAKTPESVHGSASGCARGVSEIYISKVQHADDECNLEV